MKFSHVEKNAYEKVAFGHLAKLCDKAYKMHRVENRKCRSVLIVEDDEAIRDILQFALESSGYKVWIAENGQAGLEQLKILNQPCLILLDLMMPVMDGWEFAKSVKLDEKLSHNPIVLVTASSERIDFISYKEILKKPLDIQRVYEAVGRYAEAAAV